MLLSTTTPLRPSCPRCLLHQKQIRHATLLRRPKRPYTFTQLITLSDGSTFTHRTTSPQPIYKSARDTRNNVLWNPSSQKLLNVEEDEAGRLRRFRRRFGRGFDSESAAAVGEEGERGVGEGRDTDSDAVSAEEEDENLLDLISGFGREAVEKGAGAVTGVREEKLRSGKGKGKGGEK